MSEVNSGTDKISRMVISRLLEKLGDKPATPKAIAEAFSEIGDELGIDPRFYEPI